MKMYGDVLPATGATAVAAGAAIAGLWYLVAIVTVLAVALAVARIIPRKEF